LIRFLNFAAFSHRLTKSGPIKCAKRINLITRRTLGTTSDNPCGFGCSVLHHFLIALGGEKTDFKNNKIKKKASICSPFLSKKGEKLWTRQKSQ
jgi:hypothetical protein